MPIDTQDAENAARQVAVDEDKLLITGEYTGFRALGVEGLATATGRNSVVSVRCAIRLVSSQIRANSLS